MPLFIAGPSVYDLCPGTFTAGHSLPSSGLLGTQPGGQSFPLRAVLFRVLSAAEVCAGLALFAFSPPPHGLAHYFCKGSGFPCVLSYFDSNLLLL